MRRHRHRQRRVPVLAALLSNPLPTTVVGIAVEQEKIHPNSVPLFATLGLGTSRRLDRLEPLDGSGAVWHHACLGSHASAWFLLLIDRRDGVSLSLLSHI